MAAAFYIGAVGTPILISIVKPIYWMNHYDVAVVPISAILLANAIYRLDFNLFARIIRVLACVAIPVLALPYMRWEIVAKMDGDRESVQQLGAHVTSEDVIISTGLSYVQVKYYLDLYELPYKDLVIYPPDLTPERPQYLASRFKLDPDARTVLPAYVSELADDLEADGFRRLFVFYQEDPIAEPCLTSCRLHKTSLWRPWLLPLEQKLEPLLSSGVTTKKPNARLAWGSPLRAGRTWCPI